MHIVHLCPPYELYSPTQGGAIATTIMALTREMVARGHRVSVLAPGGDDDCYSVGDVYRVTSGLRSRLRLDQRLRSKLTGRWRRWGKRYYDRYAVSVARAARRLSAPELVITYNDPRGPVLAREAMPSARLFHWLYNEPEADAPVRGVEGLDRVVCCSDYMRAVARDLGMPEDRLATVLPGVELDRFHPRPSFLEPADPGAPMRVLFMGRINPIKGADALVKAVAQLREEGCAVTLTVVGSKWWFDHRRAERDAYFRELTELMRATPGVEHLGHVDRHRLPQVVREHDVACVPSRWPEPAGLVNLEAMASGCAVVAARRGGIPELTGDAAILVEPEVAPLADALRSLAEDPSYLCQRKRQAVDRAAEMTWSATVDRLDALIGSGS